MSALSASSGHAQLKLDRDRQKLVHAGSGSESFYQLANLIVIAGGNENHPTALYAKR
jgi:hypothetical protein